MHEESPALMVPEDIIIHSHFLERAVTVTCFIPAHPPSAQGWPLLLINDGQDMEELGLAGMLASLTNDGEIEPLVCVAIHAGIDRKAEYGTARCADYMGRGAKAGAYTIFIFEELLPTVRQTFSLPPFTSKSFAGFSLGGLSAFDIVWHHPEEFVSAGVFSGSFWWRLRGLDDGYDEDIDRIMHLLVRQGGYYPWLRFFFEAGALDETMDRNHNGVIDSIDDTLALIDELIAKGYHPQAAIQYLELQEGRHDVATWAKAMPVFLKWGWGTVHEKNEAEEVH